MSDQELVGISGKTEAKARLRSASVRVDRWLYKLTTKIARYGDLRLRAHAPGGIDELVGHETARNDAFGFIVAAAGVEAGTSRSTLGYRKNQGFDDLENNQQGTGLGSNPRDYPVYVDFGTGIYAEGIDGEKLGGKPIRTIPGTYMSFIAGDGRRIITDVVEGQPAQRFSRSAMLDIDAHMPVFFQEMGHPLPGDSPKASNPA